MELAAVWFIVIGVLWTAYFVLDGFDFGVGALLPAIARGDNDRRAVVDAVGPLWDGNEVWVIVAGGATFAAFPEWYASMFSGFYLIMLAILVALIVRGPGFEYRGKREDDRWRRNWDRAIFWGSAAPAFLWGLVFANILHGVPLDAAHHFRGSLLTLLNPYALLGGLTTLALFTLHGAVYLALKTRGEVRRRARRFILRGWPVVATIAAVFLIVTQLLRGKPFAWGTAAAAAAALLAAVFAVARGREGRAFAATAAAIMLTVVTLFCDLWPYVLPSSRAGTSGLTVYNASSSHYTLTVMTWVVVIFLPVVLAYQGWAAWVFHRRLTRAPVESGPAARSGDTGEAPS